MKKIELDLNSIGLVKLYIYKCLFKIDNIMGQYSRAHFQLKESLAVVTYHFRLEKTQIYKAI